MHPAIPALAAYANRLQRLCAAFHAPGEPNSPIANLIQDVAVDMWAEHDHLMKAAEAKMKPKASTPAESAQEHGS